MAIAPAADGGVVSVRVSDPPVAAITVPVPGDPPVFFVAGARSAYAPMVFFHGACTHGLGYIQAFQFAAAKRGDLLALQGENDCGHGFRSYSFRLEETDRRIDRGFVAAGSTAGRDAGAPASLVAIGYSQGALLAESLAAKFPTKYRRLILLGSPRTVDARALTHLEGAVMMAGTYDNRAVMKAGVDALKGVGVPATFIEIPKAHHGQLLEGEVVMDAAFAWLEANAKGW